MTKNNKRIEKLVFCWRLTVSHRPILCGVQQFFFPLCNSVFTFHSVELYLHVSDSKVFLFWSSNLIHWKWIEQREEKKRTTLSHVGQWFADQNQQRQQLPCINGCRTFFNTIDQNWKFVMSKQSQKQQQQNANYTFCVRTQLTRCYIFRHHLFSSPCAKNGIEPNDIYFGWSTSLNRKRIKFSSLTKAIEHTHKLFSHLNCIKN